MVKSDNTTYRGTDVSNANTLTILERLEEVFHEYDLKDNRSIDIKNFIKQLKTRDKINNKDKNYFDFMYDRMTLKQMKEYTMYLRREE